MALATHPAVLLRPPRRNGSCGPCAPARGLYEALEENFAEAENLFSLAYSSKIITKSIFSVSLVYTFSFLTQLKDDVDGV